MTRLRLGPKVFGLCAFTVGLMVFSGGIAQAETGATWRVNGTNIPDGSDLLPQFIVEEVEDNSGVISWSTKGGTKVLFLCTSVNFDTGGAMTNNGGTAVGNVNFKECVTLLNGSLSAKCTPFTPGKPPGEILSLLGKGLIVLVELPNEELTELIKVTPLTATEEVTQVFGTLSLGETCSIGEAVQVETATLGDGVWGRDVEGNSGFLTESVTHLIVETLKRLRVLNQPAEVIGSLVVGLAGVHSGLTWSGAPA